MFLTACIRCGTNDNNDDEHFSDDRSVYKRVRDLWRIAARDVSADASPVAKIADVFRDSKGLGPFFFMASHEVMRAESRSGER
jgi:hypothetical protein